MEENSNLWKNEFYSHTEMVTATKTLPSSASHTPTCPGIAWAILLKGRFWFCRSGRGGVWHSAFLTSTWVMPVWLIPERHSDQHQVKSTHLLIAMAISTAKCKGNFVNKSEEFSHLYKKAGSSSFIPLALRSLRCTRLVVGTRHLDNN